MSVFSRNELVENYYGQLEGRKYHMNLPRHMITADMSAGTLTTARDTIVFSIDKNGAITTAHAKDNVVFTPDAQTLAMIREGVDSLKQLRSMDDTDLAFYEFALKYQDIAMDKYFYVNESKGVEISNCVKLQDGKVSRVVDAHGFDRATSQMRLAQKLHLEYAFSHSTYFPLKGNGSSLSEGVLSADRKSVTFHLKMSSPEAFASRFGFFGGVVGDVHMPITVDVATGKINLFFDNGQLGKNGIEYLTRFEIKYLQDMSRQIATSQEFSRYDAILPVITYSELIDTLTCNYSRSHINPETVKEQFREIVKINMEDANFLVDKYMDCILSQCDAKEVKSVEQIENEYRIAVENKLKSLEKTPSTKEPRIEEVTKVVMEKMEEMSLAERTFLPVEEVVEEVLRSDPSLLGAEGAFMSSNEKKAFADQCVQSLMEMKSSCYGEGLSAEQKDFFKDSPLKNADGSLMKLYTANIEGKTSFETGSIFMSDPERAVPIEGAKQYEVFANGENTNFLYCNTGVFDHLFEAYLDAKGEYERRPFSLADSYGFADYLVSEGMDFTGVVAEYSRENSGMGYVLISLPNCEIKETSDLSPKHDGKINSRDALSVSKDKASMQKDAQEKQTDTRDDDGDR